MVKNNKKLKINKIKVVFVLVLVMLMALTTLNIASADEEYTFNISVSENSEAHVLTEKPNSTEKEISGLKFKAWKLNSEYSGKDYKNLVKELSSKTDVELDTLFSSNYNSNDDKNVVSFTLSKGIYFVRETSKKDGINVEPFVINLPKDINKIEGAGVLTIYAKAVIPKVPKIPHKPEEKTVRLTKYKDEAKEQNRINGVEFNLFKKEDGQDKMIGLKDGKYSFDKDANFIYKTDFKGEINLKGLPEGEYYFKEVKTINGYKLSDEKKEFKYNGASVDLTVINYKQPNVGGKKFVKTDDSKKINYLPGAKFVVSQKVDGKMQNYKLNGKDYVVTSDKNGNFEVINLPYGTYYLTETQSPVFNNIKYGLLPEPLKFEITANSYSENPTRIVDKPTGKTNQPQKPTNPDKPNNPGKTTTNSNVTIPKTGDIQIYLYTIAGLLTMVFGAIVYKREDV